jgi:hypothetical protein
MRKGDEGNEGNFLISPDFPNFLSSKERVETDESSLPFTGPYQENGQPQPQFTSDSRPVQQPYMPEASPPVSPIQEHVLKESELQYQTSAGQPELPAHLAEMDLDLILEALAQEIQREYKRFYGS